MTDLSIWDGDGLPEDDKELSDLLVLDLELSAPEIQGLIDACKRKGWLHGKLSQHEDTQENQAISAYYWRRAQRFIEMLRKYLEPDV